MSLLKKFGPIAAEIALDAAKKTMENKGKDIDDAVILNDETTQKASEETGSETAKKEAKKPSRDFVKAISGGKISTADLRKLRETLKKIPALHGDVVTKALLDTSVFTIQMGQATVLVTYDDKEGLMANAMKMESVSPKKANVAAGSDKFAGYVIRKGDNEDEPNLHLIINKELLNGNRRKIAAAFIAKGISLPDDNIPGLGAIISGVTGGLKNLVDRFRKEAADEDDIITIEAIEYEDADAKKPEPPKSSSSPWTPS